MNRQELKKILKPLIKECIKEVIFEEGTLSTVISEVIKGTSNHQVIPARKYSAPKQQERLETPQEAKARRDKKLREHQTKLSKAIGSTSFNGVNIFEGTTPMSNTGPDTSKPQGSGALDGVDPSDPGVDISGFGMATNIWKKLAGN